MSGDNLWEIMKYDDLQYLLKRAKNKFVVLSVITSDTSSEIRKLIKLFIINKAKKYSKVTFLYYKAKDEDVGKKPPIFNDDKSSYPKLFHIWNSESNMMILSGILSVDNSELLEESFEDLDEMYEHGVLPQLDNSDDEDDKKNKNSKNKSNQQNHNTEVKKNSVSFANQQNNNNNNQAMQQQNRPQYQYKDPVLERKKHEEKIVLLQKKQKESIIEILDELRIRKREEEGIDSSDEESEIRKKKKKKKKKKDRK